MADIEITSLTQAYEALIRQGDIQDDPAQREIIPAFERLTRQLLARAEAEKWWKTLFKSSATPPHSPSKGIYLWGDVGRGKSMVMDLFYDHLPNGIKKRRIHFHAFMTEIHEALHNLQQKQPGLQDPLPVIAAQLRKHYQLLCLDEFQVHDIADAMILSRLFESLFAEGIRCVTTSNRPPRDLYLHGLQRSSFLPFIDLVTRELQVITLNHETDYRLQKMQGTHVYHEPADNIAPLEALFRSLTQHPPQPAVVHVKGRDIPLAQTADGIAWASFDELCTAALGAEDYNAIAAEYHTLFLTHIPQLSADLRNEAKRFAHLIDALYEHKSKLFCSADAPPEQLYPSGDGSFEFQRTVSRLIEMQSAPYLAAAHKGS